ncbi:MAG TPA: dienelactone hydrolase family protein [Gemmatimonadaceae bacterium]|nr:dienelactone hydrolase family protein [Gemmatimonadaceae bacterium]
MRISVPATVLLVAALVSSGCTRSAQSAEEDHAGHDDSAAPSAAASSAAVADTTLPASGDEAMARLAASPRHAEWAMVPMENGDSTRVWVVYPERREKAPVVVVIHEIFGLSPWIRAVADQLAAEGFVAVAPDLLTRFDVPGSPDNPDASAARAAIRNVSMDDMNRQVSAVARWAMALPAALPQYGVVGFCWGGGASFSHAVFNAPNLKAAVVYYGTSPETSQLSRVQVPVLGLYGGNDARVGATIPPADSAMKAMGKTYEHHEYAGAGHGFLRQQDGQNGANLTATRQAWPATIAWFKRYLQ